MLFSDYLTQKSLEHEEPRLEKLAAAIRGTEHDEEFFIKTAGPLTSMLWTAGKKLATSSVAKNALIGAGVGGVTGAITGPEGSKLSSALKGAAVGGAVGGLATGAVNVNSAMRADTNLTLGNALKQQGKALQGAGKASWDVLKNYKLAPSASQTSAQNLVSAGVSPDPSRTASGIFLNPNG